mmetsp:Transcript_3191/g.3442  ORF Transcript_3191/g.3442 Transcript_3191/m.3442 type:complete len:423 (-) Transcript_3191:151-1419(-)
MGELLQNDHDEITARMIGELEDKFRVLDQYAFEKSGEDVIQIRIHQLALASVLVNIHGRSRFVLVRAHATLGECYLSNEYHEQALEHLTKAKNFNTTVANDVPDSREFQIHILTLLSKAYLEKKMTKDALNLLDEAASLNADVVEKQHISNAAILQGFAHVYVSTKEYEKALDYYSQVWEITEAEHGLKSEYTASVYLEIAKIQMKAKNISEATSYQRRALDVFLDIEFPKHDFVAEIAIKLGEWQEMAGEYGDAKDSYRSAESLYEYTYGVIDKRTAKVKRSIALVLLKSNQYDEALQELREVEELEKTLFGDGSLMVAKTYKIIASIFMLQKDFKNSHDYFIKSLRIFDSNDSTKNVKEVKAKLRAVKEYLKTVLQEGEGEKGVTGDDITSTSSKGNSPFRSSGKVSSKGKRKKKLSFKS